MPPQPPLPVVTPAPLPRAPIPGPTPTELNQRDSIVTVSVVASEAATSAASQKATAFPIAVAIPALVGGMVLAVAGFGLYWWISRKKSKQKRERWERAQRRLRKRANSAPRPSVSSARNPSSNSKPAVHEKEFIPPVPTLPKHAHDPHHKPERGYGYIAGPNHAQYTQPNPYPAQHNHYAAQPALEPVIHEEQNSVHLSDSDDSTAPLTSNDEYVSKSSILPSRPSRSVARMAVAESAAASASADPLQRYQPKKPSPLALKAAEEKRAASRARGEHLQPLDTNNEETLAGPNDRLGPDGGTPDARQLSGEWGVALGSPNNDSSFASQQLGHGGPAQSRYSNDPYLSAAGQDRAPSGQYSVDPYAIYHNGQQQQQQHHQQQMDYHAAAKRGNWV